MKKYKMTKANLTKFVGDRAVIFEREGDNMKIVASVEVQRGFNGSVQSVPNLCIDGKTMSPSIIDVNCCIEEGIKTFSIA